MSGSRCAKLYRQIVGSTNPAVQEKSAILSAMSPKVSKQPRRIGRPPAGARAGEKVKDYPQLSIRLPADVKAKLQALSLISRRPQWRLVAEAIDCYLGQRPEEEQRRVGELVDRTRFRPARPRRD
jgi:hypothetical protein